MKKATTKEEVLELYKKYILADLELYNSTCKEGLEIRLQDVVKYLCFENKIPYQWDNNGVDEWWKETQKKDEIADIIRRTEERAKYGIEFKDADELNYFLKQTKNSDNL